MIVKKLIKPSARVCVREIEVIYDPSSKCVLGVKYTGGCDGQGKVTNNLCAGQPIGWCIQRLQGIRCGNRQTSCADQLANFLIEILDSLGGENGR